MKPLPPCANRLQVVLTPIPAGFTQNKKPRLNLLLSIDPCVRKDQAINAITAKFLIEFWPAASKADRLKGLRIRLNNKAIPAVDIVSEPLVVNAYSRLILGMWNKARVPGQADFEFKRPSKSAYDLRHATGINHSLLDDELRRIWRTTNLFLAADYALARGMDGSGRSPADSELMRDRLLSLQGVLRQSAALNCVRFDVNGLPLAVSSSLQSVRTTELAPAVVSNTSSAITEQSIRERNLDRLSFPNGFHLHDSVRMKVAPSSAIPHGTEFQEPNLDSRWMIGDSQVRAAEFVRTAMCYSRRPKNHASGFSPDLVIDKPLDDESRIQSNPDLLDRIGLIYHTPALLEPLGLVVGVELDADGADSAGKAWLEFDNTSPFFECTSFATTYELDMQTSTFASAGVKDSHVRNGYVKLRTSNLINDVTRDIMSEQFTVHNTNPASDALQMLSHSTRITRTSGASIITWIDRNKIPFGGSTDADAALGQVGAINGLAQVIIEKSQGLSLITRDTNLSSIVADPKVRGELRNFGTMICGANRADRREPAWKHGPVVTPMDSPAGYFRRDDVIPDERDIAVTTLPPGQAAPTPEILQWKPEAIRRRGHLLGIHWQLLPRGGYVVDTSSATSLPARATAGISLGWNLRDLTLARKQERQASLSPVYQPDRLTDFDDSTRTLDAEDLVLGYVPEISIVGSPAWLSLTKRNEAYRFDIPTHYNIDAPIRPGVSKPTDGQPSENGTEYQTTPVLFQWNGVSLGVVDGETGRELRDGDYHHSHGQSQLVRSDGPIRHGSWIDPLVSTEVPDGSLPALRFTSRERSHQGRYHFRVRVVDLSGNGIRTAPTPSSMPVESIYVQHECVDPISAPEVLLWDGLDYQQVPGRGLTWLVVSKQHPNDSRALMPPRVSFDFIEKHGLLDHFESLEGLRGCEALGQLEDGSFVLWETHPKGGGSVVASCSDRDAALKRSARLDPLRTSPGSRTVMLPYFPDPRACLVCWRLFDVDGSELLSSVAFEANGGRGPDSGLKACPAFYAGQRWPNASPIRLALRASDDRTPQLRYFSWTRTLSISLPPGVTAKLEVSCMPLDYDTIKSISQESSDEIAQLIGDYQALAPGNSSSLSHIISSFNAAVRSGSIPSFTPAKSVWLSHAVPEPMAAPTIDGIDRKLAGSVIRLVRPLGKTGLDAQFDLSAHCETSAKIQLEARWKETIDDITKAAPEGRGGTIAVGEVEIDQVAIDYFNTNIDASSFRPLLPCTRTSAFDSTKFRRVNYIAKCHPRYAENFPGHSKPVSSAPVETLVLNSASPPQPVIRYVVPTFRWEHQEHRPGREAASHGRLPFFESTRRSQSLRIFLDRPWYVSGDDERLALILGSASSQSAPTDQEDIVGNLEPAATRWGVDPLRPAPTTPLTPAVTSENVANADSVIPGDNGAQLALFKPSYDADRRLWYCDIEFANLAHAFVFVRLVTARYQPYSVDRAHCSAIARADFAQLWPSRSVFVQRERGSEGNVLRVTVCGLAGEHLNNAKTDKGLKNDIRMELWAPAGGGAWICEATITPDRETVGHEYELKTGAFALNFGIGPRKLVVYEKEWAGNDELTERILYLDILEL